jgi:hypothetical protein
MAFIVGFFEAKSKSDKKDGRSHPKFYSGGYYRDRTYDLLYVKQMLSQLS